MLLECKILTQYFKLISGEGSVRGRERDCKSHLHMIRIQICLCVRRVSFRFQVHIVALVLSEALKRLSLWRGREEGDAPALENCL